MKGQHVAVPLPHFFQPGAFFLHVLENLSSLEVGYSFDRHKSFLRLGGCLNAAMGASVNTGLSSGFLNNIDLKCLLSTEPMLGRKGLKLKGAMILSDFFFSCIFFLSEFSLLSSKLFPGRFLIFLYSASMILGW